MAGPWSLADALLLMGGRHPVHSCSFVPRCFLPMLTFVAAFPRSLRLRHRSAGIALAFFRPRFAQSDTVYPIGICLSDQVRPRLSVLGRSC